jgi:hypothetical protein
LIASSLTALVLPAQAATLSLVTAADHEGDYNRSAFRHWIDADKDGCDTRAEVLIEEATVKPKVGKKCALTGGKWRSQYDKLVTTNPSTLDIDHLVPLAEAWRSGAWAWTDKQREDFANDLTDARALVAVSASSNRSKGDKDYSKWQPKLSDGTAPWIGCNYLKAWIAIKMRYQLTIDPNEATWIEVGNTTCAFGDSIKFLPYFTSSPESSSTPAPALSPTPSPSPDYSTRRYFNTYQFIGITYKDFSTNFARVARDPQVLIEVIDPPPEYLTEDLNDSCVIQSTLPEGTGDLKSAMIFEGEQLKVLVRCRWILGDGISGASWKWRKGTSKLPLVPTDCAKLIEVEIEGFKALQCVPSPTPSPKSSASPSATSGGVKRCWVNGYTRSNGTTVQGYYRSC